MLKTRKLIVALVGSAAILMTMAPAFALAGWVSVDGRAAQEKPSALVQRSNDIETVIEFDIKGFRVEEVTEKGETFKVLRFPYYHTTQEIGRPQLPVITELVGIPGSANVRATVVDYTVVTHTGYKVYPFQTPLLEGEERVAFDIDADLYARDAFYPEMTVEVGEPGIWRDIRVVNLRVNPVQYNPATGELKIYQRLTVKLEYYGTSSANVLTPRQGPIPSSQRELYRSTVLNYGFLDLNRAGEGSKSNYDLLIISVDALVPGVAPLVAWKNSQLVETQLTFLSAVPGGTTANDIKNYITSEYNNSNISFVLLVGDIADLPIYTGYTGMVSDYWYALLTGSDDWPEVAVGRISATTTTQVLNVVNKSIAFEDSPTGDWLDRALLVANLENAPGKYQQAKEEIRTATDTPSGTYRVMYPTFTTAYGASAANGGDDATNADVTTAINNGQVVVNYRGHGDTGEWWNWNTGGQSFTNADAKALNNGDMTPVVFSIACNTTELDAGECLGEAFTNEVDAAVAFLGASRPSYTIPNHTYDKQLFSAVFDEGLISIGNASNLAAIRIIQQHGSSGLTNARMYLWLGDPSLTFSLDPSSKSYWLVAMDTSGSMGYSGGIRIIKARELAVQKVNQILQDPDDEIALATFGHTNALNLHFDWTRDGTALVNDINTIWAGDPYTLTPLADAACAAANKLITDVPIPPNTDQSRRLFLLTDGGENNSSGACSGPPDPVPNPPWDDNPASWHALVLNTLVGNMIVDLGYFGNIQVQPPSAPPEGSAADLPTRSGEDSLFLATLVDTTGGDVHNAADTAICGNGILESGEECDVGFPCPGTDVPVYVRFLCRDCKCVPETNVVVQIPNTECVDPGDYVCLPIWVDNNTGPLGGFELEVEFDYTAMTFVGAEPGEAIQGFEKFTYRLLPCPACGCCKYKILLYGQYDMPNGVENIGEPIPLTQPGGYQVLVELCFVVNNDENLRGLKIPICFEWEGEVVNDTLVEDWECGENTFSSWSGDTLYTSRLLCQFNPDICDDPGDRIQPLVVFQYGVCGQNCGGVDVCPAGPPDECKRGDVNYNTITYEVADAVLFASYFVQGTSVFRYDMAYQICATDVNADGRTLTLSDLVYLIRVILHDAVEIPKLTPSSEVANVIVSGGTISTECAAPIGAILFEFDSAVNPTLLADMEMVHNGNKVLVWSSKGKSFSTAEVLTFEGEAQVATASAVDRDSRELSTTIAGKVAPPAFALHRAYPNPFNPFTNLSFALPEAMRYSLKIYNVAGQLVRSYESIGSVGLNVVTWDSKDNVGSEAASGIYFYKLSAGSFSATEKMVLMK